MRILIMTALAAMALFGAQMAHGYTATVTNQTATLPNGTMHPIKHYHFDIGADETDGGYTLDFDMLAWEWEPDQPLQPW